MADLVARRRVERRERLVEEQELGLRREGPRQRDPLRLAARERPRLVAGALGQTASGVIDVGETTVLVSVQLSWLLARFANAAAKMIGQQGTLMLEKK